MRDPLSAQREDVESIIGTIPTLPLGDSDGVCRTDSVMSLGYPLGQESLKATTGVVSGQQSVSMSGESPQRRIQTSAPFNPGSSGGPLLNINGEVIGITYSLFREAQNTGYAIPINELKHALPDMMRMPIIRRSYTGALTVKVNDTFTDYLGNPQPGGCYMLDVIAGTPFEKAGVLPGDMIYEINGNKLDIYGDVTLSGIEDNKLSMSEYSAMFSQGDMMRVVLYRKGERKELLVTMENGITPPVKKLYPWVETPDYEVFAGIVVMELSVNHLEAFEGQVPGLARYTISNARTKPILVITHMFQNSLISLARSVGIGFTITRVNGREVFTLEDYREAVKDSLNTNLLMLECGDQMSCASDYIPVVLPLDDVLAETVEHAKIFKYPLSPLVKHMLKNIQD